MMAIFAVIGGSTFQPANGNWFAIDLVATTNGFAGTRTCATKNAWYDIALAVQQICLIEARLRDQTNIGRYIGMSRAANLARNICLVPVRSSHNRPVSCFQLAIGINHLKILS